MPVIEVTDLRKSYDGRAVVDGVSFAVEEGDLRDPRPEPRRQDHHRRVRRGPARAAPACRDPLERASWAMRSRVALTTAETADPDVILMDLRMPGGGGVDAIRELTRRGLARRSLS
jgi:CheY-like chemotaxis protein